MSRLYKDNSSGLSNIFVYGVVCSMIMYFIPSLRIGGAINQDAGIDFFLATNLALLFFTGSLKVLQKKARYIPVQLKIGIYLFILSVFISSFFAVEIQYETSYKFMIFLLLPYFFIKVLNSRSLILTYILLIAICFGLTLFGFYGYFTGNVGMESQAFWWGYAKYWGIHYTESTRNSDVYVPAVAFFMVLPFFIEKANTVNKFIISIAIIIFLSAVILSLSRGAWIATIAVILAYAVSYNKFSSNGKKLHIPYIISLSALVIITFYVALSLGETKFMADKFNSIYKLDKVDSSISSNEDRVAILIATADIIINNPFGVGLDNLRYHYPLYGLNVNHAENNYVNILAELGLIGFVGFIFVVCYPLKMIYKMLSTKPDTLQQSIYLVALFLTIAYFFNVATTGIFVWILHAISWSLISIETTDTK